MKLSDSISIKPSLNDSQRIKGEYKVENFEKIVRLIQKDHLNAIDLKDSKNWLKEKIRINLKKEIANINSNEREISGNIEIKLYLTCQNCLNVVESDLNIPVNIILCKESKKNMKGFEIWEIYEEKIKLRDLIEELIIISLPLYFKHENTRDCIAYDYKLDTRSTKTLPFANLKNQLNNDE
tara:strand:+ start:2121 stop:2663 length:543 start_codon:yes stop_codon:yes gene_type:complete